MRIFYKCNDVIIPHEALHHVERYDFSNYFSFRVHSSGGVFEIGENYDTEKECNDAIYNFLNGIAL